MPPLVWLEVLGVGLLVISQPWITLFACAVDHPASRFYCPGPCVDQSGDVCCVSYSIQKADLERDALLGLGLTCQTKQEEDEGPCQKHMLFEVPPPLGLRQSRQPVHLPFEACYGPCLRM